MQCTMHSIHTLDMYSSLGILCFCSHVIRFVFLIHATTFSLYLVTSIALMKTNTFNNEINNNRKNAILK